jgi:hypothetical protein
VNVEIAIDVAGPSPADSLVELAAAELGAAEVADANVLLLKRMLLDAVVERTVSVWIVKMMSDSFVVVDAAA